ncbi:response regulator, partial [Streptomyces sp. SID5475]|nr:response regulator [Streptomyces sp. SID5475]
MIRVLVVDDDFMVARLHGRQVEQLPGFTVVGEARSGAEALAAVRELRPDLVLLDIYLPDMGGLDVLRALRQGGSPGSETDVLVVTAARDAETVRGALRGGAVHYIIKPFEAGVLHERLLHYARRNRELRTFTAPGQDDVDRVFAVGPAAPAAPAA